MTDLTTTFAALSDATRFAIVERLMRDGAQAAGDLSDVAPISAPALSRHLKVLREAGIVTQTVDRQRRIYALRPESMMAIDDWITNRRKFWEASLDRLDALVANLEPDND
ncbi:HTH-type transcriptional regulator, ArsR family protein [Actibacterium atlanticum]|uniref:HTH-type transcriptional regulator, ArsR family protein n=1 Tax=Actibacterium atlanticum TaxID=1461693 RepID=A0A058ZN26_9RHOB|nr:metalloregulator ArsR/SmtB family transcription factor [Actibacterium atlanticum]KCV82625.1 HTH-type transcriptional regulator, ArsR family protein [Actibacterium atlanticum]